MSIEDFLASLTPEQLEHLADVKRKKAEAEGKSEQPKSKRKQSRKKEGQSKQRRSPRPKKKETKKGRKAKSTVDKMLDKRGKAARRLGPTELGERPNRFLNGDLKGLRHAEKDIIAIDQAELADHWKGKKPTGKTNRPAPQMVDATCSKCDIEYENVSESACYRDGGINVFICEDCVRGMGG